jgi:hypothetical protein
VSYESSAEPTASILISSIASARSNSCALLRLVRYAWEQLARRPRGHPTAQLRNEMGRENRAIEHISDHHDSDDGHDRRLKTTRRPLVGPHLDDISSF